MNLQIHKIGASRENSYNIAPKLPKPPDKALGRAEDMGFTTEVADVILTKLRNVPADSVNVADTSRTVAESSVGASGPLLSSTRGEPSAAAQMFGDVFSEPSVIVEADLPSPFNESARAEGCRCVEHRGGGGFNAGSWTSRQRPLDCRCVGGTGDNVPSDLGDGVVKL
ncbi:hypothetical protein IscW_ISCW006179 [Ixodes scapularis]|uniref:Uncharacterized protein n=1 Tax=Ixodes scapularis TaxID=6945 RepID=B7PQA4_IXOSC|nr:hypothetical protein IscW_ISCW006179 [Ixodes scapularis]|eukprot:XP_002435946.1 hypothetical protein IscW_ISCW006179 [Ixodes scapularis]